MISKNKVLSILVIFLVLTMNAASAAEVKKNEKNSDDSKLCEDGNGNEVSEEFGGIDANGEMLVKRITKHFAKSSSNSRPKTSGCYSLMGVKWTSFPVSYVINPTNTQGLTQDFITSAISQSAETWDAATSRELFNNVYNVNITGVFGVNDGRNTIVFGDNEANTGVIAVTSTWYTMTTRRIVDFDLSLEENYAWGNASLDPTKMDVQNIGTHELGHGVGLNDLYNTCTAETMYGYSGVGETSKRTLNPGDIAGIRAIYGI